MIRVPDWTDGWKYAEQTIRRDARVQTPAPSIVSPLRLDLPVRMATHRVALNAYGRDAELSLPAEFTARNLDRVAGYLDLMLGALDDAPPTPAPDGSDAE